MINQNVDLLLSEPSKIYHDMLLESSFKETSNSVEEIEEEEEIFVKDKENFLIPATFKM